MAGVCLVRFITSHFGLGNVFADKVSDWEVLILAETANLGVWQVSMEHPCK